MVKCNHCGGACHAEQIAGGVDNTCLICGRIMHVPHKYARPVQIERIKSCNPKIRNPAIYWLMDYLCARMSVSEAKNWLYQRLGYEDRETLNRHIRCAEKWKAEVSDGTV